MSDAVLINGRCDSAFKAVREALAENLTDGEEIGEVVSVVINGKTVVDLWGGYKNRAQTWLTDKTMLGCSRSFE